MKLRKIMSLTTALAVVMTCIATVFAPVASAETEGTTFTEDFDTEEYTAVAGNATETSKKLFADSWYPVANNRVYTSGITTSSVYHFAEVVHESTNNYLKIKKPTGLPASLNAADLGLGRRFPGQSGSLASGIWEITFKFKPDTGTNKQFYFGLNTQDTANKAPQHNIISATGSSMYIGYHDYTAISDVPQCTISTINNVWYNVKAIVNCDAKYYSVELRDSSNNLVARRSPISFGDSDQIGFFKMSALDASAVYVDDIEIKPAERATLIYEENFEELSGTDTAQLGVTTGSSLTEEDTSGGSYFEGYTPWRAYQLGGTTYSAYAWTTDFSGGKAVRLGSKGSGLIYMPVYDKLVDSTTQGKRGMLKTSFKVKPANIVGYGLSAFNVYIAPNHTSQFTDISAFAIKTVGGQTGIDGTSVAVDKSKWYDVELIFDVEDNKVFTTVTDLGTSKQVASFTRTVTGLSAIKGVMFAAAVNKSDVSLDDIKLEYTNATVSSVKINNTETTSTNLAQMAYGKTVDIEVKYVNNTDTTMNGTLLASYFNGGRFVYAQKASDVEDVPANSSGKRTYTFTIPGADALGKNLTAIKICLWDDIESVNPYFAPKVFQR